MKSTTLPLNACNKFGPCIFVPVEGPLQEEGPCQQCYCQCTEQQKYEEICCEDGLIFNPFINHCDWPIDNEDCVEL